MSEDLFGLSPDALVARAAELDLPGKGKARAVHRTLMREGRFDPSAHGLGARAVAAYLDTFHAGFLEPVRVVEEEGELGITAKAVLRLEDGLETEVVFIPMGRDRSSLCVSSQVGCKMGCTFCETARMGLVRSLRTSEIVAQLMTAKHRLGWDFKNVVFMGMGDALDNADAVFETIAICNAQGGLEMPQERFTVCTVGHRAGLERFLAQGYKRVNLSVSLNAPDDPTRSSIMPANRKLGLDALSELLGTYRPRPNFVLGVNYCLLPGINDGPSAVDGIVAFCQRIPRVLVNVIPYNPGLVPITRAPDEAEIVAFIEALKAAGLPVRRRITKGRTVMAACGQLGNVALRRGRALPTLPTEG